MIDDNIDDYQLFKLELYYARIILSRENMKITIFMHYRHFPYRGRWSPIVRDIDLPFFKKKAGNTPDYVNLSKVSENIPDYEKTTNIS